MRPVSNNIDNDAEAGSKSTRELMIEILRTVKLNKQMIKTYEYSLEFVHSEMDAQKAETVSLKHKKLQLRQQLNNLKSRMNTAETELLLESDLRDEGEQNSRMLI